MATTIVRPVSTLVTSPDYQHWANSRVPGGTANDGTWSLVDEESSDDDTSFFQCATANHSFEFFRMGNPSLPAGDVISNVRLYFVCRHVKETGYVRSILNSTAGPTGATKTCSASFQAFYQDFSVNPITGVAWTEADIYGASSIYFGVDGWASATKSNCRCTQVYAEITHAPAPTGVKIDGVKAAKVNGVSVSKVNGVA